MTKKTKGKNKDKNKSDKLPFVSVCTPTFNRRPFIPIMIKCFEIQDYPKDKVEWLILDDGSDKIEELVTHIPQVKYMRFEEKLTLGKKRNILNDTAKGEIIVYMDDDDYYPPDRISHAVEKLSKSKALCAGSSEMFIYFKHINKMYKFGPYGPNHATAGTFAFKKELLKITRFEEDACLAEERKFLKEYTIPFIQLEPKKSILVFSHIQNTFDKKELLKTMPNPTINDTDVKPEDIIKNEEILNFFMRDIDKKLDEYKPGSIENKPDVLIQLEEIKKQREKMMMEYNQQFINKQINLQTSINNIIGLKSSMLNSSTLAIKFDELQNIILQLIEENNMLKHNLNFLEQKFSSNINNTNNNIDNKSNLIIQQLYQEMNNLRNQIKILKDKLNELTIQNIPIQNIPIKIISS